MAGIIGGHGAELVYCRLYDFFREQGSIIAGLLALFAGFLAYYGSRKAAAMQVTAAKEQTDALREQNAHLIKENRRKLAEDSLVAIRLVIGAVERIGADITDLIPVLVEADSRGGDSRIG